MKKIHIERIETIDLLRGVSMLSMIMLHTNAYFLNNSISRWLWDNMQFAVPVFVFCSSYVFFKKEYVIESIKDFFIYLKKRFERLLIPYYIFMVVFMFFVYIKEPAKISSSYILQNITLVGGIDINWLILLFVYFSIIMPIISWSYLKHRKIFFTFLGLSILSALYLNFFNFPYNYRFVMWIPWSVLVFSSMFIVKNEKNIKNLLLFFGTSFVLFVGFWLFHNSTHKSLLMYYNKYPPNFYYVSYGTVSIIFMYVITKLKLFSFFPLRQLLLFLSKYSYSLFFIHYLIIFILFVFFKFKFNWITFFITITILSILSQVILNTFNKFISPKKVV